MKEFPFLPYYKINQQTICQEYETWLKNWLNKIENGIENNSIASSECIQGILTEQILYGRTKTDWIHIKNELLRDENGRSISYSKEFSKKLWHFENQWKQNNVNSVFNDMWIDHYFNIHDNDQFYGEQIELMIQSNGWIYNNEVSETQIRTRMKSELTMSMYMGVSILKLTDKLDGSLIDNFKATLSTMDNTYFVSAEYFRTRTLELLDAINLIPNSYDKMIKECELEYGYSDFDLKKKVDDYMGTKKRTRHDHEIASPLVSSMVKYLSKYCEESYREGVEKHISDYKIHLNKCPMDIKAFKMRDIDIPFGTDITPMEIIAAINLE